jgi:hypothetical protein
LLNLVASKIGPCHGQDSIPIPWSLVGSGRVIPGKLETVRSLSGNLEIVVVTVSITQGISLTQERGEDCLACPPNLNRLT